MDAFQYTADNARQDASGLKHPDADPFFPGPVPSEPSLDFDTAFAQAQRDSGAKPELQLKEFPSTLEELDLMMGHTPSPLPTTNGPNQQRQSMPLHPTEPDQLVTPSTDSPSSNSSSSAISLNTHNTYSRKRKSADSIFSEEPQLNHYQTPWARPSNFSWEQDTKDTVNGINGLYMGSKDVSPSSSLTSSVMDNQHDLLGVSIPNLPYQYSSESSTSSPLEMCRSQNQAPPHIYPQDSTYTDANINNMMFNHDPPPNNMPAFLPQFHNPAMSFQPHYNPQYMQLKVISTQTVQYAPLRFLVLANRMETRVETALDIRLVLIDPPSHINKLRMNKSHLYKAKSQAQSDDTSLASDTVEVRAVVFRAYALKNLVTQIRDPEKEAQAMNCARTLVEANEEESRSPSPSTSSEPTHKLEPIRTPCRTCINREKKRLNRGPQTPKAKSKAKSKAKTEAKTEVTDGDVDEANSKDTDGQNPGKVESEEIGSEVSRASRRMVTMQVKAQALVDWQLPPSQSTGSAAQLMRAPVPPLPPSEDDDEELDGDGKKKKKLPIPPVDEGTIAVDMALRICCYCRHKNEDEGYCIVFTLIDHHGKVVGLTITDPININDSHKDKKNKKENDKDKRTPPPKPVIQTQGLPGEGVFPQQPGTFVFQPQLPQSRSAPNLSAAPQGFHSRQLHQAMFNYVTQTPPEGTTEGTSERPPEGTSERSPEGISERTPEVFSEGTVPPEPLSSVLATMTPNRSRPASPSAPTNPAKRQRAQGSDRRVPNNLVMTPLPSEAISAAQDTATITSHSPNSVSAYGSNNTPFGHLNTDNFPTMAARRTNPAHRHSPSASVMRQNQAGYRTNPSTPPPFTPTFAPGGMGFLNPESGYSSGVFTQNNFPGFAAAAQGQSFHLPYQMPNVHNDGADPRQQPHGIINPPSGITPVFPINPPIGITPGFPINPANNANFVGPNTITGHQFPAQHPQVLRVPAITYVHPNSGSTEGEILIHILGVHLFPGLKIYFGNRAASDVIVLGRNGLTCVVPRVNRPQAVPVYIVINGQMILPYHPYPQLYYTYVDAEDQSGLQSTQCSVGSDYSPYVHPEYIRGISQPQEQIQQNQGQLQPWIPRGTYQKRHRSSSTAETPPSYEDATTQEQRDKFNRLRSEKDQKTFSTLQAAGDTIADYYASEMFDSPQVESSKGETSKVETSKTETSKIESSKAEISKAEISKAETSKVESSKVKISQVETSKAVTKPRKEYFTLLEQKREVKGLRSDLKLWAFWIPILVVVLTLMLYTHATDAVSICLRALGVVL